MFRPAPSAISVREGQNLLKLALMGHHDKDFDTAHKPRLGENGRTLDNLTIKRDDNVYMYIYCTHNLADDFLGCAEARKRKTEGEEGDGQHSR